MKAALEAMARRSGAIAASDRRAIRRQGARIALRSALNNIERLGLPKASYDAVKACVESMIADAEDD